MKIKKAVSRRKRLTHMIIGGVLIGLGICVTLLVLVFVSIISNAPDIDEIKVDNGRYSSWVYDDKGEKIDSFSRVENVEYAYLDEIPAYLQQAIISIEDPKFYEHKGVDLSKIGSAMLENAKSGSMQSGGTTITEQVIKNNFMMNQANPITRRIEEAYLATELEKRYSKDVILEYYLNKIDLGGSMQGVQSVARRLFGKDVNELNLTESAVLTAMIERPTYYNPNKNPENNWEAVQKILNQMVEQGYITDEEKEQALQHKPYDEMSKVKPKEVKNVIHSYFVDAVYRQVFADLMAKEGISEIEAKAMIFGGGLRIYTTLDASIENVVERYMSDDTYYPNEIKKQDAQAAFIISDYRTGEVKALYGGRGQKDETSFDYATLAVRQPGSTIKTLAAYAPAIDYMKLTPDSEIMDEKFSYKISNGSLWTPKNGGEGYSNQLVTLKQALAKSLNTIPVRLAADYVGVDVAYDYLKSFGFAHITQKDKTFALALGALTQGVTPLELNAAYGTIANGGEYLEPIFYTKVEDRDGNIILDKKMLVKEKSHQVIKEETAKALTQMLEYAVDEGTGKWVKTSMKEMPVAGKTGTTMGTIDLWFTGYTPYYAATIWSGSTDLMSIMTTNEEYQLPLWGMIMSEIHSEKQVKAFDE